MQKFNPSNEEIVLIEQLIREVILVNVKHGLDIDVVIGKEGVDLYAYSKQGLSSWDSCASAVTETEFRSMFRWLCEQKEKAFEKTI